MTPLFPARGATVAPARKRETRDHKRLHSGLLPAAVPTPRADDFAILRRSSLLPLHPLPALASLLRIEPFAAEPLHEFLGVAALGTTIDVETLTGANNPMFPRAT
ncbi:MAG TPA: hypothetical protein VGH13_14535 [Xanthobacteraceae bacterium]